MIPFRRVVVCWTMMVACWLGAVYVDAANVEVVLRNTTSSTADFHFQPLPDYGLKGASAVTQVIQAKGQSKPSLMLPEAPIYQLRRTVSDGGERVFTVDLLSYSRRARDESGDHGPVPIDYRELVRMVTEQRTRSVPVTKYRSEVRMRNFTATKMVPETRTRSVNVTKYRSETRTRTVRKYDAMLRRYVDKQEQYVVQVPYTETVEQSYTVSVPETYEKTDTYTVQTPYTETIEQAYTVNVAKDQSTLKVGRLPEIDLATDGSSVMTSVDPDSRRRSLGVWLTDSRGALVSKVIAGTPATRLRRAGDAGQLPESRTYSLVANGDWILMVNDESVTSREEAVAAIQRSPRECHLLIRHGAKGPSEWFDVDLDFETAE